MTTGNKKNLQQGVENTSEKKSDFKSKIHDWWYNFEVKWWHWWHDEPVVFNAIVAFIVCLILGIFIWVLTLVFLNPLFLLILGFICPKWIVRTAHRWCKRYDDLGLYLYWKTFKGIFEHLPWYARKHYINYVIGFDHADTKDQWRLFMEMDKEEKQSSVVHLNKENQKVVWETMSDMRYLLADSMYMTCEQFDNILYPLDQAALKAYMAKHPSLRAELLVVMRDRLDWRINNAAIVHDEWSDYLSRVLAAQIEDNGAPQELILGLGGCTPDVFNCVKNAMEVYTERQAVLSSQKSKDQSAWKDYCAYYAKSQKKMSVKAQILMNCSQYEIYRHAGLELDEEAVLYLLRQRDYDMVQKIFKYETIAYTPALETILYADSKLYRLYINKELKESKSSSTL